MSARAQRQNIDHLAFVIAVPRTLDKAALGVPAHRYCHAGFRVGLLKPVPLGTVNQLKDQAADFGFIGVVAIEPAGGIQRPQMQHGGIDCRKLGVAVTQPAVHIEEVVEEPLVPGCAVACLTHRQLGQKTQSGEGALAGVSARDPAALHPDRIGGQRKSDGRYAGK